LLEFALAAVCTVFNIWTVMSRTSRTRRTGPASSELNIKRSIEVILPMAFLLGLATFLLYSPALMQGFIHFDDPLYVSANTKVQGGLSWESINWAFQEGHAANWHPLTWISHMLDCELFGLNPWGHHLTNNLIHSANGVLLFLVLQQMTGAPWRSLAVASFFALHPLRVESVAWISERKDVLSGFFFFLTLLSYTIYVRKKTINGLRCRAVVVFFLLTLFLFALGLMSKPMLVTLPFLLLLLDYWPLARFSWEDQGLIKHLRFLVYEKIPFILLTLISCLITYFVQRADGATHMFTNLELWPRLQNVAISYVRYIGKTFWPADLSIFYPFPPDWWHPGAVLASAFSLLIISITSILFIRRFPCFSVGWFWFLGMMVPVIGFVQVGHQSMADRYTYLPSIGLSIALAWGCHQGGHLLKSIGGRLLVAVCILALLSCALLTRHQLGYWKDAESLFRHAKSVTPPFHVTALNLGVALCTKDKFAEALVELDEAIDLAPNIYLSHFYRGKSLEGLGRPDEAIKSYQTTCDLSPSFELAQFALARLSSGKGDYAKSESIYRRLLDRDPDDPNALFLLGCLLQSQNKLEEATTLFKRLINLDPGHVRSRVFLGTILRTQGSYDESRLLLQQAVEIDPLYAQAHSELAILLSETGNLQEAVVHFEKAHKLDSKHPDYLFNMNHSRELLRNLPPRAKPNPKH
jgi:protein O-mannosyl-transferase